MLYQCCCCIMRALKVIERIFWSMSFDRKRCNLFLFKLSLSFNFSSFNMHIWVLLSSSIIIIIPILNCQYGRSLSCIAKSSAGGAPIVIYNFGRHFFLVFWGWEWLFTTGSRLIIIQINRKFVVNLSLMYIAAIDINRK